MSHSTAQPVSDTDLPTEQPGTGTPITGEATDPAGPFQGPFWTALAKRRKQNRDAKIIVTADHGATGVGKTALAVYLAKALDQSAAGFDAAEKSTVNVHRFLGLYDEVEPQSAIILDEAEQIDARRSMKNENIDAAEKWQTRRVNEIAGILTLPSPDALDSRMESLADYWINVEVRGRARIYEKRIHRTKRSLYYKTMQTQGWPNLDHDPDYQILAKKKEEMINDEEAGNNWVRKSEVDERIKKVRKNTRREVRDEIIHQLVTETEPPATALAPAFDISANRIRQIAKEVER